PADLVDTTVVDGRGEIVAAARRLEIHHELHVDLEGLRREKLVLVVTVSAIESHVREDDPVAQPGPPSVSGTWGCARRRPRTLASPARAARPFASPSCPRTMSTPAAIPSAVVAIVPSTRSL